MKFLFLALSLAFLLKPLGLQVVKKIFNNANLKPALGASLIATILFSATAAVLSMIGVVLFDVNKTVDVLINELPIEQYLLNFSLSFGGIAVYLYLNQVFPKNDLQKYSLALSNLLIGLSIAFLFFAYPKWFTMVTFAMLVLVLLLIEYVGKIRFMYWAYRAFAVMLIPLLVIYGILFNNGTLKIASNQLSDMYLFKIPVEQCFMFLAMFLVSVYMFEFFKARAAKR
ncbi:lycopene cyclase domain-containing protein [Nubsella zeaxanthinifaciens]|uniref:lycopene cyclase domain-containing protein n=1 Tax=Nubsella zeaxanthinifaciens TaxID=392412 RepID=UPI000DE4C357|nr:lycopene cyclase domain-containing protein [Nubsella zeaxanthinifaciens]